MPNQLQDDSLAAWLRLYHTPGIGGRAFQRILERFSTPEAFLLAPRQAQLQAGLSAEVLAGLERLDEAAVEADLRWLEAVDHHVLRCIDPRYPERLRCIPVPPPLLSSW